MSSLHRRKGGTPDVGRKTVIVRYEGREHAVSWFSGTSDEAISRAIGNALGLPRETPAIITDPEDGSALVISNAIPDGLTLDAAVASKAELEGNGTNGDGGALHWQDDTTSRSESPSDGRRSEDGRDEDAENDKNEAVTTVFRGEMLKYEKVDAHLANERTWLAWMRTALSALAVALDFLTLSGGMGSMFMDALSSALGISFVVCTLLGAVTAWLRYVRVVVVLGWTESEVRETFGRFDLIYFARSLAVVFILAVPVYIAGGVNIVTQT